MKKNYIKPSIIAVTVIDDNLMQQSIDMGGSKGTFNSSTMQQASRGERSSSWEDDEE